MDTENSLKCLLVDDEDAMLTMLSQYVEMLGFSPIIAHDGMEGLTVFREHRPDLVVSDIHMPMRNGIELLHEIKKLNPYCPVILITGYLTQYRPKVKQDLTKPDALIEKPFNLDKLERAIANLKPAIESAWSALGNRNDPL